MTDISLLDGTSAAIVFGGTALATLLRCGPRECGIAFRELASLGGQRFRADEARAELAVQVQQIRKDGLLRVEPLHTGDSEFDEATDALIRGRSITGLVAAHERHKARRQRASNTAVRLFAQAAELAPVFGMVGTLVSLSTMPKGLGDFSGAIAMAVQTTLYGLLIANLLFAPLARIVERAAAQEERERQKLVDWLTAQVVEACPTAAPHERRRAGAEAA